MQLANPISLFAAVRRNLVTLAPSGAKTPAAGQELLTVAPMTTDAVMAHLGTSLAGLPPAEAVARLEQYGLNEVAHEQQKSALRRLAELFATPLSILLLALALVNYVTGEVKRRHRHRRDGGAVVAAVVRAGIPVRQRG